jgi:hypothetical protein
MAGNAGRYPAGLWRSVDEGRRFGGKGLMNDERRRLPAMVNEK